MEGDEIGIFSKIPDWELCFFLRQKLNKTQAAQTGNKMQSSSIFIRISGPIPRAKKSALINNYEDIVAYSK